VKNETTMFTRHSVSSVDEDVNDVLKKFWEIETVDRIPQTMNRKDEQVIELMRECTQYDEENERYEVPIPWKENKSELSSNYEMAVKRLESTEKRLKKDPELEKTYRETIEKYESKGYVSKSSKDSSSDSERWYLPHFPVVRMNKTTTKVRMVFDASAKSNGLSLNDVIHQGPKLQNELFDVLLRFRQDEVALICDIEKMYLQVGLFMSDRKYHSFLWREKSECEPTVYEFNRVVFGVNASPFLAQYVSQENARRFQHEYPLAAKSVTKSTYMDDTMESVKNEEMGIALYTEMCKLWKKAGMNPRKWMSNSEKVLAHIPQGDRAFQIDLSKDELPCIKTLGLNWISESDMFTYHYNEPSANMTITKRAVLKTIASLFDPLGFLVPFTVRAKIIMQKIWLTGLDWDDPLPETLATEIRKYFSELTDLDQVMVPRCLHVGPESEINTFVDASNDAYGAIVYHTVNAKSIIVASKGRVAPIKTHSIPRLELMAAVLGLTLTIAVCGALEIDMKRARFWTDSMNVLHWIHNQSRQFKPFVANRIGTIHQSSTPMQWRYVPSKKNPADLASRGESVSNLVQNDQWWQGPDFLKDTPDCWPEMKIKQDECAKIELKRKSVSQTFVTIDASVNEDFGLNPKRFSDLNRLVRVSAWVHRFIDNCQVTKEERRLAPELSVQELEQAENRIFIAAQSEGFSDDYKTLLKGIKVSVKSKLAALNPKLDSEGVMRSDSRLKFTSVLSYDANFPILLPRKHWITRLVVKQCHENVCHSGVNSTLTELSKRFWVVSAREEIRELQNMCTKCKLINARVAKQIMGTLPKQRSDNTVKAFVNTAVDYAGPFITKQGRGKTRLKRYLCVFTCMTTRAVHLEVAYGLDTNSFMNALSRFTSRRGVPACILSNNGTNFVGCVNELRELYDKLDKSEVINQAAVQKIDWKFIPPSAPHFGGIHESMVKSAKRALYKILSNADVSDEELVTAVAKAESLINSRPLTYQSSSPDDDVVLTPNHFLIGQMGGDYAPDMPDAHSYDVRTRWRRIQELSRHFWKRWLQEYLPTLGRRAKWRQDQRDFKINDVVLIVDTDTPRGQWPLGRITNTHPGPDGHVRVVDVKTSKTTLRRPISRLSLIAECSENIG